eukprot:gene4249-53626_t
MGADCGIALTHLDDATGRMDYVGPVARNAAAALARAVGGELVVTDAVARRVARRAADVGAVVAPLPMPDGAAPLHS